LSNLNQIEKNIYNCFLKHYRNGQPYQPRKDFSNLDSTSIVAVKKLYAFFSKFPHISYDDFFGAPRELHPDENCPHISYFTARPAIRSYSLAMKKKEDESPEKQIEKIRESFHFIALFCLKNRIGLDQYIKHKTQNMPTWMQHYREHHVNPYALLGLSDFNNFGMLEEDQRKIWSGDFFDKIGSYKNRLHSSDKTKSFVHQALKKIEDFLKKELQTHQ
jgi:hypothetical protein